MANLQALRAFAAEHAFGLTRPLTHQQVVTLARYWQPDTWFYVDERFHPIALDERITMVERRFRQLSAEEQERWRVSKLIRTGQTSGNFKTFDPPVVHVPDGPVSVLDPSSGEEVTLAGVRVLNDDGPTADALEDSAVNEDAVFTHGATAARAREFFGARRTRADEAVGTSGDPLLPRADGVTVMASYKNLFDLLKYELLVEQADNYPPDALRGGFDIAASLFDGGPVPLAADIRRQFLLDLIATYEAGDFSAEPPELPPGYRLNRRAWNAVTRYAFLEYDYFYAYNDWDRYQTAIWENEHEGDDEGCCLVFDRNIINLAAIDGAADRLRRAVPHCIIGCVHLELHDLDDFAFIPTPIAPPDNPDALPRDNMKLNVYVAGGSHATYLTNGTNGTHDVADFGDFWAHVEDAGTALLALPLLPVLILLAMIEHFQDTEDFTSDDGLHTGPADVIGDDPAGVPTQLVVIPMSANNHIYMAQHAELLRLRAYPGKWGGHHSVIDQSAPFGAKSGRYFRKLLRSL